MLLTPFSLLVLSLLLKVINSHKAQWKLVASFSLHHQVIVSSASRRNAVNSALGGHILSSW